MSDTVRSRELTRSWEVRGGRLDTLESLEALKLLLLTGRGVTEVQAAQFFIPTYEEAIHDPHELHEMGVAVERIQHAISAGEHILVYGDYDADGVTSTAILIDVLGRLGARVTPFLPHRLDHGYGLNGSVLETLADAVDLVITVDCGVANIKEIAWLTEHGVDAIVIDHHTVPEALPGARAVVHPAHPDGRYPFVSLCGAGVTWKVASALLRASDEAHALEHEKWLLDLVAIGTIADIVPLLGENRALVTFGLEVLRRTRRMGLKVLLSTLKLPRESLSAKDVGWKIVPLINAAGRIDHPQAALDLLTAQTDAAAAQAVARLQQLNTARQVLARKIAEEAETQAAAAPDLPFVFAHNAAWPAGVVGLVANKLAKAYARPAIVVGGNGRHAVGSARSPVTSNVLELLRAGESIYTAWGGHAQAAGFSLAHEHIEELRVLLTANGSGKKPAAAVETADAVVAESLLAAATVRALREFAPFGEGNEYPRLIAKALRLVDWRPVGKDASHAKFTFEAGGRRLDGIGFGLAARAVRLEPGMEVDVLGELEEDEWRGRWRLQFSVRDIAPAGTVVIRNQGEAE